MGRRFQVIMQPAKPPGDVEGLSYTTNPVAPGLQFFPCIPLRSVMSQTGCGKRWSLAQVAKGYVAERYQVCRGCPIGAVHAGERPVRYSWLYGQAICPRCRNGGFRMIGNRLCVNCYNRSRELKAGKNGRGNKPVELMKRAPRAYEMRLAVDGHVTRHRQHGVDMAEPMFQALRTMRGELAFGFSGPTGHLRQGRLF